MLFSWFYKIWVSASKSDSIFGSFSPILIAGCLLFVKAVKVDIGRKTERENIF